MGKKPMVLALLEPIILADGPLTEITLREPKGIDLRGLALKDQLQVGDLLDLAAEVSGLPVSAINTLSCADTMAVVRAMGKYMAGGTGDKQ